MFWPRGTKGNKQGIRDDTAAGHRAHDEAEYTAQGASGRWNKTDMYSTARIMNELLQSERRVCVWWWRGKGRCRCRSAKRDGDSGRTTKGPNSTALPRMRRWAESETRDCSPPPCVQCKKRGDQASAVEGVHGVSQGRRKCSTQLKT